METLSKLILSVLLPLLFLSPGCSEKDEDCYNDEVNDEFVRQASFRSIYDGVAQFVCLADFGKVCIYSPAKVTINVNEKYLTHCIISLVQIIVGRTGSWKSGWRYQRKMSTPFKENHLQIINCKWLIICVTPEGFKPPTF
ncbi:MAG: hypothetical protein V1733_03170 [bacterium]